MPLSQIIDTFALLISVVDKLMDVLPNYDQRKRKEFYNLRQKYENEKKQSYPLRDDNKVGIYRDKLLLFMSEFKKEIGGSSED